MGHSKPPFLTFRLSLILVYSTAKIKYILNFLYTLSVQLVI